MTTTIRTKRPFTKPPNEKYAYGFPLSNCVEDTDSFTGDPPHDDLFLIDHKNYRWPNGVRYPKHSWEKVG